jgi:IS5 family transposase
MRQERTVQASIFDLFASHEIGQELKAMSQWLDDNRDVLGLVARDLRRTGIKSTGRQGLSAEAVLRCALLKQYRQLSYQELAFHLEDSASFRAFARLPWSWSPKKSVLQRTISAIRPQTWEEINRILLSSARQAKLEDGAVVRLDSTVTSALMHAPSDSSLLWDAVRVMVRLLRQADTLAGGTGPGWRDHRRAAKRRARKIQFTRGRPNRVQLYRELIAITRATLAHLEQASAYLAAAPDPFIESQIPESQEMSEHIRTYDRFLHLLGWFILHMPLLLGGLYLMTLGGQPIGGAALIFLSMVILIFGIGRTLIS